MGWEEVTAESSEVSQKDATTASETHAMAGDIQIRLTPEDYWIGWRAS